MSLTGSHPTLLPNKPFFYFVISSIGIKSLKILQAEITVSEGDEENQILLGIRNKKKLIKEARYLYIIFILSLLYAESIST